MLKLKLETQKYFPETKNKIVFDSAVISHVMNYIDYKLLLFVLTEFVRNDGLVFINNVVDYGLPEFFSDSRPKGIPEMIKSVKEFGYSVVERRTFETTNKAVQKNKRLILIIRNHS